MRTSLIEKMKTEIETTLKDFLREEGIELCIAANDNTALEGTPAIELEAICEGPLEGVTLLSEIKVILGILGKPWQCEALVGGIYQALHPHNLTQTELTVLLMSLHIEALHCVRPRLAKKRAVMRYVVEEVTSPQSEQDNDLPISDAVKTEYC